MTTYLGKSCSFCLPRVHFVNCGQFMYLVISLLVLRAGCGIWLCQFLIIAYLFTLDSVKQEDFYVQVRVSTSFSEQQDTYNREMHPTSDSQKFHGMTMKIGLCTYLAFLTSYIIHVLVEKTPCWHWLYVVHFAYSKPPMVLLFILFYLNKITLQST